MRILVALLLLWTASARADVLPHANRAAINAEVTSVFTILADRQLTFVGADTTKRYVQLVENPTPLDGTTAQQLNWTAKRPTDRTDDANSLGIVTTSSFLVDYIIDEYVTPPRGPVTTGYLLHAEVDIAGIKWRRTLQVGPEDRGFTNGPSQWYAVEQPLP